MSFATETHSESPTGLVERHARVEKEFEEKAIG